MERTLVVIKPDAISKAEQIKEIAEHSGFYVNRRKDTTLTADQAKQLFPGDESQAAFVCSGPVVLLVLSKVDAVQSWQRILGPADPAIAKRDAESSIRSQFGTDCLKNAAHGSESVQAANREIDLLFSAGPVDKLPAREYLLETVMPGLVEALTDMCFQKPADPYAWLTQWLQKNRPRSSGPAIMSKEPVLKGHNMKSDTFEGIHMLEEKSAHSGIWNCRAVSGEPPIFGVGQCSSGGLLYMLQDLKDAHGIDKCFCAQLREDPVVYINGEPCSVRSPDALNDPVDALYSIDATELEAMEARLKRDVLSYAGIHRGQVEIYYQQPNMDNELNQVNVQEVFTMRETFDWLVAQGKAFEAAAIAAANGPIPVETGVMVFYNEVEGWKSGKICQDHGDGTFDVMLEDNGEIVEKKTRREIKIGGEEAVQAPETSKGLPDLAYYRIPITDETPPEEKDFDDVVTMMRDFAATNAGRSVLVFSCTIGRGRTTMAMVCASILWYAMKGWQNPEITFIDRESPNLARGEWKGVIDLLAMLDDGMDVKSLVDKCIDECAHIQNLREAIAECKKNGDAASLKRGQNYLERYCYLILFAAYARGAAQTGFSQNFSNWMSTHWTLKRLLKRIVLE